MHYVLPETDWIATCVVASSKNPTVKTVGVSNCLIYDVEEGKLQFPIEAAGVTLNGIEDIYELIEECSELEGKAKDGKVTSAEYGRIKEIVTWRVTQRYLICLNNGMSEREAGQEFAGL